MELPNEVRERYVSGRTEGRATKCRARPVELIITAGYKITYLGD